MNTKHTDSVEGQNLRNRIVSVFATFNLGEGIMEREQRLMNEVLDILTTLQATHSQQVEEHEPTKAEQNIADIIMDGKINGTSANEITRQVLEVHHQQVEEAVRELRALLKECEPFLSDHTEVGVTTLAYIPPAERMRRAAERMEYEAKLKERVREALTPNHQD